MEPIVSFGYWLRRQRKALDLTQQALADQVGCSLAAIKKIEQDERRPSRQIANLLADALGVPASQRKMFLDVARGLRSVDQLSSERQAATASGIRSQQSLPHNLPLQLTSFIGREKEIAEVIRLLEKTRLVTLTGPGGTGKTRLAIQVANEPLNHYPDGVWMVGLAPILDPLLVLRTTAVAIGLRDEPHRPMIDMLCDYLRDKEMLLLLDNCEHLIEACAQLVDTILHACPKIRILATSREALGIAGETLYLVPSLTRPDTRNLPALESLKHYQAIQLFIDRATSAVPAFTLTDENASAIAQICQHLDGIPLAIELAAGKIRALSPAQIAQRLSDRFHLLTGGSRTSLPRHQTLQATIDWSYNLLSAAEQSLFRRSAVFVGGWTLEVAELVCSDSNTTNRDTLKAEDIFELLTQIVNKSLVITEERNGEVRYHMLETIRQYARDKLFDSGEAEHIRDHHFDFFLTFAEEAEPKLHGSEQLTWFNYLETEHDNFRSALEWAIAAGLIQEGFRLANALRLFWYVRGHWNEGRQWLTKLLKQPGALSRTIPRAGALASAGFFATYEGDFEVGRTLLMESITLCHEFGMEGKYILALALFNLGWNLVGHDTALARVTIEQSLATARQLGYKYIIAISLNGLGNIVREQGGYSEAQALYEESLATVQQQGDKRYSASPLAGLGFVLYKLGDPISARAKLEQSLTISREMRDDRQVATTLSYLGDIEQMERNYNQAQIYYQESLELWQKIGGRDGMAESLECFAALAIVQEENIASSCRAVRLLGAAQTLRESFQLTRESTLLFPYDHIMATAFTRLGEKEFKVAWAQGKVMTLEQAIEYALTMEIEGEDFPLPKIDQD